MDSIVLGVKGDRVAAPPLFSHPIVTPSLVHDLIEKKTNFNGRWGMSHNTCILYLYTSENWVKIQVGGVKGMCQAKSRWRASNKQHLGGGDNQAQRRGKKIVEEEKKKKNSYG